MSCRRHRYEVPSDVHSTEEMHTNVALAIVLCTLIASLALANILLSCVVKPFSALLVVAQP